MKLFLHPGHAKCGSTSIQKAIIRNRAPLAERGIVVPDHELRLPGEPGFSPHGETPREFFRRLMETQDMQPLASRLNAWRESSSWRDGTFLISAENLINHLMGPIGRAIHGLLAETFESVEVVYYIRRQDEYLLSAWQQWGFKQGKSFATYLEEARKRSNPHFWAVSQVFGQIYGANQVAVVPLDRHALREGDLLTDFFHRLMGDTAALDFDKTRSNVSWNPYLCEVLAEKRELFRDIHDDDLKQRLLKLLGPGSELFRRESAFMSPEDAISIMAHHEEENRRLHRHFFPGTDFDAVFGTQATSAVSRGEAEAMSLEREREIYKRAIWDLIGLLQSEARSQAAQPA
ncbi:hypothetical protein [Salinicola rhizosphaerae]|uniref:Sulfotransferase family protein n=1 Tax=Salinicola rhizosphaerae TaxID=1443141 RepID=A0ABQ3E2E3_9GAMM|nr:hypothetical protein [Salinicola rhizosphaerae]GHB24125.1 hypothetical protein GCM10009038_23980 [Salinicola rhizosphaerae]